MEESEEELTPTMKLSLPFLVPPVAAKDDDGCGIPKSIVRSCMEGLIFILSDVANCDTLCALGISSLVDPDGVGAPSVKTGLSRDNGPPPPPPHIMLGEE